LVPILLLITLYCDNGTVRTIFSPIISYFSSGQQRTHSACNNAMYAFCRARKTHRLHTAHSPSTTSSFFLLSGSNSCQHIKIQQTSSQVAAPGDVSGDLKINHRLLQDKTMEFSNWNVNIFLHHKN
jgi:hypothetical protein